MMRASEVRADGYETGYEHGLEVDCVAVDYAPWCDEGEDVPVRAAFYQHRDVWLEGFAAGAAGRRAEARADRSVAANRR